MQSKGVSRIPKSEQNRGIRALVCRFQSQLDMSNTFHWLIHIDFLSDLVFKKRPLSASIAMQTEHLEATGPFLKIFLYCTGETVN